MKAQRSSAVVLVVIVNMVLVVCLAVSAAHAAPPSDDLSGDRPVSMSAPTIPFSERGSQEIDPAGYWTEERMRSAIPADELASDSTKRDAVYPMNRSIKVGERGDLSHPVLPQTSPERSTLNAAVPATAGKVFFTYKGKNYVCSGSAINGPTKNIVATAGHCVHGGKGEGWHSNLAFAPAFYEGLSSYGLWNWKTAYTFQGWTNSSDSSRDQAFFTVYPRNGKTLVATVGGNGLSYNYGHSQTNVRIWGWPAEPPYQGQIPYYCDGNTQKRGLWSNDMVMSCGMTGGASGGPWLRSRIDANLGYVFGVTSRRTTSGEQLLISTPFDDAVKNLFQGIG